MGLSQIAFKNKNTTFDLQTATTSSLRLRHLLRKVGIGLRPQVAHALWRRLHAKLLPAPKRHGGTAQAAMILIYHRVAELDADPQMLSVTPWHFAEQLSILRKHYEIVPLRRLVQRLQTGQDIAGMVALTFDDGYADNLLAAKPLLEQHDAPATIFIASDYIGKPSSFWWDELEAILLDAEPIPQKLRLNINGSFYQWDFGSDALYERSAQNSHRQWHVKASSVPTRRHHAYQALHSVFYDLPPNERERMLEKLRTWAQREPVAPSTHRILTPEELRQLASSPLIEIGAHTATHPALSMLPREMQQSEIADGKRRLEEMLGYPTVSFAYPYGSLTSFDANSVRLVKAAGFDQACTTFSDTVRHGCDTYQLPRLLVRNYNGDEFERYLRTWVGR